MEINDSDLLNFIRWRQKHIYRPQTFMAGLTASMMVYFHVTPRECKNLIERMLDLGLIVKKNDFIKINLYK